MDDRGADNLETSNQKLTLGASFIVKYLIAIPKLLCFFVITLVLLPFYLFGKSLKTFFPAAELDFFVKRLWSKIALWFCRVKIELAGENYRLGDAYICNHVSWLDILVLQSILDMCFVAKSEVKGWFGLGFLARLAETIFIDRRVMEAKKQQAALLQALKCKKKICIFPEGTSSDGQSLLPFKSSLFEVFMHFKKNKNDKSLCIQPATLLYYHEDQEKGFFYAWWGEMSLLSHIVDVVAERKYGKVRVVFHNVINTAEVSDRKSLCSEAFVAVGSAFKP